MMIFKITIYKAKTVKVQIPNPKYKAMEAFTVMKVTMMKTTISFYTKITSVNY